MRARGDRGAVLNGFEALAAALADLADQADDAIAGGAPPKHVAQQAAERARQLAYAAAMAGRGRIAPADLAGMLGGDTAGETMVLGHPRPAPEPSGCRRAWRAVRREVSGARAWLSS